MAYRKIVAGRMDGNFGFERDIQVGFVDSDVYSSEKRRISP